MAWRVRTGRAGPSSELGGARQSTVGRGRGNSVGGHIPKCFVTKWAQGRDREVDRASGCRAQGSVRALPLWWANGRLGLLGPFPAGQVNRWPHKQKHADTQAHGHTDHTHRDVHKAVHGDKHMQEHTCPETHVCAHKRIHICTDACTQTHRGACFSGCLLPTPPTSYSFSPSPSPSQSTPA